VQTVQGHRERAVRAQVGGLGTVILCVHAKDCGDVTWLLWSAFIDYFRELRIIEGVGNPDVQNLSFAREVLVEGARSRKYSLGM